MVFGPCTWYVYYGIRNHVYYFPFLCYFPFVIFFSLGSSSYSVYKSVFFVIFFFFPARSFSSVGHLACGGGARQIVSPSFYFHFFSSSFSLSICLLCFCFLFDCFFSFPYFIDCVCRSCRIY